jgi:predicted ATPase
LAARLHQVRREAHATQEQAEALLALSVEQGFAFYVALGTIWRGWALAEQNQGTEGIAQIRQGLAAYRSTGAELARTHCLALLAEVYGKVGQIEEGLAAVAEALAMVEKNKDRWWEAELHRLKGELLLQQTVQDAHQAEICFQHALAVARQQQATSWELRTATSLSRLWQRQGKRDRARELLTPIYSWFTEGFDSADLQEAKALLKELS